MYIYEMPYLERKQICGVLDQNNKFEELGLNYMKFDSITVQNLHLEFRRGSSPTHELLTLWSHQNHTVDELFILLSRMKHYRAMTVIKELVDERYHFLLRRSELSLEERFSELKVRNDSPAAKCQVPANQVSRENNSSVSNDIGEQGSDTNRKALNVPSLRLMVNAENSENVLEQTVIKSAGMLPHITYEELKSATNNWHPDSVLGRGGFGTVFKGKLKLTDVAIKRLEQKEESAQSRNRQIDQSITELHCLNTYRHDNVLPLYGYSVMGPQPCLVYQFMPGGSLDERLHLKNSDKVLNWTTRLNIAIGTARGLQFLHTIGPKPLIHGDIKSANILLDENDKPRIGDFGLAREGPQSNYIRLNKIHGTLPYLPNEFLRYNKFSTKVDTYSFGVVLFEIVTALPAYSKQYEKKYLRNLIVDMVPDLQGEGEDEIDDVHFENALKLKDKRLESGECYFKGLVKVGLKCVRDNAKHRPEMVQVLLLLLEQQEKLNGLPQG